MASSDTPRNVGATTEVDHLAVNHIGGQVCIAMGIKSFRVWSSLPRTPSLGSDLTALSHVGTAKRNGILVPARNERGRNARVAGTAPIHRPNHCHSGIGSAFSISLQGLLRSLPIRHRRAPAKTPAGVAHNLKKPNRNPWQRGDERDSNHESR